MKNKLTVSVISVAILGTSIWGASSAFAQGNDKTEMTLVQKLADKFGLKRDDVQAVFNEHRDERQQNREAKLETRLSDLVKQGKLTDVQKTLILNKIKELQDSRKSSKESLKNMTPAQRKVEIEKKKSELETWAKDNNINLNYLFAFGLIHGMGWGRMGMMGK